MYDRVGEIESRDYNVNNQISFNLRLINLEIFNFDHREQLLGVARTVGVREREAGLNAVSFLKFFFNYHNFNYYNYFFPACITSIPAPPNIPSTSDNWDASAAGNHNIQCPSLHLTSRVVYVRQPSTATTSG